MEKMKYEKLKCIRSMVAGAIQYYEIEGDEIIRALAADTKPGLIEGMETIGAALYWIQDEIEDVLHEAEKGEKG